MLKALHRFTQLLRVHIYVPGCCKYIRMTNGLQPLAALCMDGRFAGQSGLMQLQLLRTQKSFANTARNSRRATFFQTGRSSAANPQDFRPASRCDRFQPATSPRMPLRFETSADP